MLLTFGFENFDEVKRAFDPVIIQKAMRTTITRTARKARTNVSKEIRKSYTVKAAAVKETVSLRTEKKREDIISILSYRGGSLPIDRFSTSIRTVMSSKGRRRAVSARVKKSSGRRVVKGAFPLHGTSGPTMERTGEPRENPRYKGDEKIERVFRLSVPQMINPKVRAAVEKQIGIDANIELNRNLEFFQTRAAR